MVLNIERLKEKNRLAKTLVEKGLASDMEDASARIDNEGMVHNTLNLDTKRTPLENLKKQAIFQSRENEIKEIEKDFHVQEQEAAAKIAASDPKILARLERLEGFVREFRAFFDKYRTLNDSNLKELDSKLKSVRADLSSAQPQQKLQQTTLQHPRQPELKRKPEAVGSDTTRASFDTSEYSVDKVFSNSHGRLTKKKPC